MSRDLPEVPNLDHLKKQAMVLLRKLQQRNPAAKLAAAQHALAREYGFASWPKLKAHIESILCAAEAAPSAGGAGRRGTGDTTTHPPESDEPGPVGPGHFARYTETARRTIFFARYWAHKYESRWIQSEHLLLGLIEADGELFDRLLRDETARADLRSKIEGRRTREEVAASHRPLSSECRRILEYAAEEANRLRHTNIGTRHFMLGLTHEEGSLATAIFSEALATRGLRLDRARNNVLRMLKEEPL
jgi:hypothetical protein